ncbi:DUF4862 family protein [Diaminobutyricibacter sp. McL0618]|uniref:DUF4862 family protein n=1 Tax=Leifsonia sp. McL0618 TaxID=3415677 RepID=UPI003CEFABD6
MSFFVGAYATVAKGMDSGEQDLVYEELRSHPLVRGFEIPFADPWTDTDLARIAHRVGSNSDVVITTVPGLFRRGVEDSRFGPASPDEVGRRNSLAFLRHAWDAARRLGDIIGPGRIAGVSIVSSPRRSSCTETVGTARLADSMAEVLSWDWSGSRVILEHCDALTEAHRPAKGYLPLADEVRAVTWANTRVDRGATIGINWGRSAIEGRAPGAVLDHLGAAIEAGLLGELIFSGCAAEPTRYGDAWADAHAPSWSEDPLSLLTPDSIADCFELLSQVSDPVLTGLKVSSPPSASAKDRIELLDRELRSIATAEGVRTT